jgi:hypothetical protein
MSALTQRSAVNQARAAYDALYEHLKSRGDPRLARLASIAHARGSEVLAALEREPGDFSMPHAAGETLEIYLHALSVEDPRAQLAWLEQFPVSVRNVWWQAQPAVSIARRAIRSDCDATLVVEVVGRQWQFQLGAATLAKPVATAKPVALGEPLAA